MTHRTAITVGFLSPQPLVAEGLKSVLEERPEFELAAWCRDLSAFSDRLSSGSIDIALIDCASRVGLAEIRNLQRVAGRSSIVLWGEQLSPEFALHAMECGVRGFLPGCTSIEGSIAALQAVWAGQPFCGDELMRDLLFGRRVTLTRREGQLASLLSQGLKNKELAATLGITEGTVKVYLSRLFRKVGVKDRFELALFALKNLNNGESSAPPQHPQRPGVTTGLFALSSVLLEKAESPQLAPLVVRAKQPA
jgi:DNA-binding NarL/FixJ family response regulator